MVRRTLLTALVVVAVAALTFAQASVLPVSAQNSNQTYPQTQTPSTQQTAPTTQSTPSTQTAPGSPETQTANPPTPSQTTPSQTTTPPSQTTPSQTTTPSTSTSAMPQTSATNTRTGGSHSVSAGTEIKAVLDTPLSSKTSNVGDRFTATINDPVMGNDGSVAIPAGSKISGQVVQAESGKTLPIVRGRGKLNMRFDQVMLPSGQSFPLRATLESVNDTNGKKTSTANSEGQVSSGTKGTTAAKDVGIGAGVGTLAGLIFGSAMKGLAIGAIAGGGYVLATQGKDVNLPAQSGLVLKLDEPLNVSGGSTP